MKVKGNLRSKGGTGKGIVFEGQGWGFENTTNPLAGQWASDSNGFSHSLGCVKEFPIH